MINLKVAHSFFQRNLANPDILVFLVFYCDILEFLNYFISVSFQRVELVSFDSLQFILSQLMAILKLLLKHFGGTAFFFIGIIDINVLKQHTS